MLTDTYYIPRTEMPLCITGNLVPILQDGLFETSSSDPLNLYTLHVSYNTTVLPHHQTTTNHPSDYSTFSGGQVICPLFEVAEVNKYLICPSLNIFIQLLYLVVFPFSPLQFPPLFCAVTYSCYRVYFVLSLLTPYPIAFPLLLGPMWVRYLFSL